MNTGATLSGVVQDDRMIWRILALAAYFLIIVSPNLLVVRIYPGDAEIKKFLLSCIIIATWHLAFRRARLAMIFALPFFLILPFVLFSIATYHEPPTLNVVASVFDTNPVEARDYLSARIPELLGYCVLAAGGWVAGFWGAAHGWPVRRRGAAR